MGFKAILVEGNPRNYNSCGFKTSYDYGIKAFPMAWSEAGDETLQALIDEIHTEKYTIAPNCAVCQTPCGKSIPLEVVTLSINGEILI